MAKPGETVVKSYLMSKGLIVRKIPGSDIRTADFAVHSKGRLAFYLIEKTIERTSAANKILNPVYQPIAKHIKEAKRQFKSVNPDKRVPNVLAITNKNPNRNVNHLFSTLTGQVITATGKFRWLDKRNSIEDDLSLIDLYLWFDNDQLSRHIFEGDSIEHQDKLATLLGLIV